MKTKRLLCQACPHPATALVKTVALCRDHARLVYQANSALEVLRRLGLTTP